MPHPAGAGQQSPSFPERFGALVLRSSAQTPALFVVPMVIVTGVVLLFRQHSADGWLIALLALLACVWNVAWHRALQRVARGGTLGVAALLTVVGAVLLGVLLKHDVLFILVLIQLIPRAFVALPLWLAMLLTSTLIVMLDVGIYAEMRQLTVGSLYLLIAVHLVALSIVGMVLRAMVLQARERQQLLESLATSERSTGQLEERQRLAREIHDTLAQGFAAILTHLEAAELSRQHDTKAWQHVGSARQVAREQLEEARRMMGALKPEVLEQSDLSAAIHRTATEWSRRTGVPAVVEITGEPVSLHRDFEVALLRAEQEALANVWKHARASRVAVTLSYIGSVVVLDVQDDGIGGVDLGHSGFGLTAMQERVTLLGGSVTVEGSGGEGTTLTLTLPNLQASAELPVRRTEGSLP